MGTGRRKNRRSELNLLHNHLKYPSYALLTLLSSSSLYKCLKEGMAKKKHLLEVLDLFHKRSLKHPWGRMTLSSHPSPPSIFNPSVTISLLLNSQSPLLSSCWPVLCSSCSRCVVFSARCTRVRPA